MKTVVKSKTPSKQAKVKALTPPGLLSYPYLFKPDEGRGESDGKWKGDLFISKTDMKEKGKDLIKAVLKVGREYFKDPDLGLEDFKNPIKDIDKLPSAKRAKLPKPVQKGYYLIRAKTEYTPAIIGPDKEDLDAEEVKKIKGGDLVRFVVMVYPYSQQGGGVTLGLNLVQFIRPGKAFGQGKEQMLNMLDDIEIEADEVDVNSEDEAVEDENEDEQETETEDSDDSDDESEDDSDSEADEDEDEDLDFDNDSDETEDEDDLDDFDTDDDDAPKAKTAKRGRPTKKVNAKVVKRSKKR